jgi:hypothetical protein
LVFYFAIRYESSPSRRLVKKFGGFADGRHKVSPDSEEIELA